MICEIIVHLLVIVQNKKTCNILYCLYITYIRGRGRLETRGLVGCEDPRASLNALVDGNMVCPIRITALQIHLPSLSLQKGGVSLDHNIVCVRAPTFQPFNQPADFHKTYYKNYVIT